MKVKFKKVVEEAILPEYKTSGSVGMDVCSVEKVELNPMEFKIVSTGLACELQDGYEIQVRPRSGLACKHGITVINTPGTVDNDFRGTIGVGLINLSNSVYTVNPGDRIAQFVVNKVEIAEIEQVDELGETERGAGGFGSTGK